MTAPSTFALGQSAFLLIVAFWIDTLVTMRRIVQRLKAEHRGLWISLGSPEALTSFLSSRADVNTKFLGKRTLTTWLSQGDYRDVNDAQISKLASRLIFDRRAMIAIVILFLLGYAWIADNR
jgi:hypothetical protein